MDYATRQFIFLTKKFRKELRKYEDTLHRDLTHLSDRIAKLKDAVDAQRLSDERRGETPAIVIAELRTPEPIRVESYAPSKKSERVWGKIKRVFEVLVGIAVIGYTILTWNVWHEQIDATNFASKQTKISREGLIEAVKNFRAEQRPVVFDTNNLGSPTWVPSGQVVWTWSMTNYGKSPSQEVMIYQFMKIGNRDWKSQFMQKHRGQPDVGSPEPPGKVDFDTVISDPGITKKEFDRIHTVDHYIGIKVKITYRDANGMPFESQFCYFTLISGAINYCPTDNYIH